MYTGKLQKLRLHWPNILHLERLVISFKGICHVKCELNVDKIMYVDFLSQLMKTKF